MSHAGGPFPNGPGSPRPMGGPMLTGGVTPGGPVPVPPTACAPRRSGGCPTPLELLGKVVRWSNPAEMMLTVRENVIGQGAVISTPYGDKRMIYADYVASGRSLQFVEDCMRDYVQPLYGNTHSEASATATVMSGYREKSRAFIQECVNGTEDDVTIFCGSGASSAIDLLIQVMQLKVPEQWRETVLCQLGPGQRPVVFVSPYEHHSNELSWRETIAEVITIPESPEGDVDVQELMKMVGCMVPSGRPIIVSLSAASNVTGVKSNIKAISHFVRCQCNALLFWDYAAGAPYVDIDMDYADAVFISPHKFVGGPGTPGVLVAKKKLFVGSVPHRPGGGTVAWVDPSGHAYNSDLAHREEGGTPDILGSIRCGLVFALKKSAGTDLIHRREDGFLKRAMQAWQGSNILVLGPDPMRTERLSIVSFVISVPVPNTSQCSLSTRFLHYNFVVALMNDVFGLQARGGCSCAGPYGHRLMGIDQQLSANIRDASMAGFQCTKPGWVRVNFNYFISEEEFQYIVCVISLIAQHGHRMLNSYKLDPHSGVWTHKGRTEGFNCGQYPYAERSNLPLCDILAMQLSEGEAILKSGGGAHFATAPHGLPVQINRIRWFAHEADYH